MVVILFVEKIRIEVNIKHLKVEKGDASFARREIERTHHTHQFYCCKRIVNIRK